MTVNQQLSSLGATVLQSNVSFSDAHHLPILPVTIAAIIIIFIVHLALILALFRVDEHMFLPVIVTIPIALVLLSSGITSMFAASHYFGGPSQYTIEISAETNMAELLSNFEIIPDRSVYPILTVTPK